MTYRTVLFDVAEGYATLTLNRPDRLNAVTMEMHKELRQVIGKVRADDRVRCLLLTGAGRGFCSGQDLSERVFPEDAVPDLGESLEKRYNPLIRSLRELPLPVVCAVNGVAAGAGCNLALACDIVIAARAATFVQPYNRLGLIPDAGGTWNLPRLVGPARAMGLAMLGESMGAEKAEAWGMIWRVVDDDALTAGLDQAGDQCRGRCYSGTTARPRTRSAAPGWPHGRLPGRRFSFHGEARAALQRQLR